MDHRDGDATGSSGAGEGLPGGRAIAWPACAGGAYGLADEVVRGPAGTPESGTPA